MRLRPTSRPGVFLVEADETKEVSKKPARVSKPRADMPEIGFASEDEPRTPKKTSLFKSITQAAQKATAAEKGAFPDVGFADDDAAITPKKRSISKGAVNQHATATAKPQSDGRPDEQPETEPDAGEEEAETDQEQPDVEEQPQQPSPRLSKKETPVPPKKPPTPMGRAASFSTVVARLRKRYRAIGRVGPRTETEHVGVWSVMMEDGITTPLILAEEANWRKGIWISLWPTEKVQRQLARIGGVPPEEIHLTLVYVGRIDKTTHADVATIASVCEKVARKLHPFTGQVTGIGRFSATTPDDLDTIYASFTSPRLDELRAELLQQLTRAGLSYTQKYGFTPHMTLAKIPQRAISPLERLDPFRLRFSWLTLKVGDWRHDYKLGG